jgi:hypothetical protein
VNKERLQVKGYRLQEETKRRRQKRGGHEERQAAGFAYAWCLRLFSATHMLGIGVKLVNCANEDEALDSTKYVKCISPE